jgi:pimeloyl-ACP methyl ester carboxylesterase
MRDQISHSPDLDGAMRGFMGAMVTRPEDLELVMAKGGKSDPATVGTAMYEMFTTDLRPELGKIAVPVLLVAAGAGSQGNRGELEAGWHGQIDAIRNKRLVIVDDAKHFVMLDQPAKFFGLLDEFLARRR